MTYTLQFINQYDRVGAETIIAASDSDAVEIARRRLRVMQNDCRRAYGLCRKRWFTLMTLRNEDTAELIYPKMG